MRVDDFIRYGSLADRLRVHYQTEEALPAEYKGDGCSVFVSEDELSDDRR